jgi:hypothetical protein
VEEKKQLGETVDCSPKDKERRGRQRAVSSDRAEDRAEQGGAETGRMTASEFIPSWFPGISRDVTVTLLII